MSPQKRTAKATPRKSETELVEEEVPAVAVEVPAPTATSEVLEKLQKIQEHMGFLEKKLDQLLQQRQERPDRPPFRPKSQDFQRNRPPFKSYDRPQHGGGKPFYGNREHGRHGGNQNRQDQPRHGQGNGPRNDSRPGGFRPKFYQNRGHQGGHQGNR